MEVENQIAMRSLGIQFVQVITVRIRFRTYEVVFRAELVYLSRLKVIWFRYNQLEQWLLLNVR
ncbi:MAG: hypothetical protein NPIRA04_11650 [Nitrospirales bacterium]|nr:MAG: hypothetical protein NPIRA04_11650 [Nitrospirales bacterium]